MSPKYLNLLESKNSKIKWLWGAATLVHLYYNLGASLRVNVKALACCTTLPESWIFEDFSKLPGISKPNDSRVPEYCTRWSWSRSISDRSGERALKIFRETLDNYKLEDVVWDPYLEKRADRHMFKKVASFTNFISSSEHLEAYYPNRVQRQFSRRQYVPRNPISLEYCSLRFAVQPVAYKLKYNWADLFSGGKWKDSSITLRGRKVHDGIPACVEKYFEWFKRVSFTKLCSTIVNLDENNDGRILSDDGTVGGGVGSLVGGGVGGGGVGSPVGGGGLSQCEHISITVIVFAP
ncbi:hypothetical protein GIB67_038824 [Kingdonia uniflora]|uniref:Aminotransferase-like plant mobile domain-containing protein n=1 Tax=Kingdonia uniflora TaxID=39325 RepID=A0A7J7M0R7_9MAGN|nr:hypothetical protein GIB67_038824 [Kingdonia uniflora]